MINLNVERLQASVDATRAALGEGITSASIWDMETGLSLFGWNEVPEATALFNLLTGEVEDTLQGSGFPKLKDYYMMDLHDGKSVIVISHGHGASEGWILETAKVNYGVLIGMAIPKAMEAAQAAFAEAQARGEVF